MTEATTKQKAYNYDVVQQNDENRSQNVNGTDKIVFRGELTIRGRKTERTFVAQGKAAALISDMVGKGNTLKLRCVFNRAPANEDGTPGGEYLTVVDLPREKQAAA